MKVLPPGKGQYFYAGLSDRRFDVDSYRDKVCAMNRYPTPDTRYPTRRHSRARGFTLIEAALTTVIVGTGVLAIVGAQQAYHQKNEWAQRSGTAMLLANEIRELTLSMPKYDPINGPPTPGNAGPDPGENALIDYDDLDDFAGTPVAGVYPGTTINPPIDALRRTIADLDAWTQVVTVESVLEGDIGSTIVAEVGSTPMTRITVNVMYLGPQDTTPQTITQLTWVVGD